MKKLVVNKSELPADTTNKVNEFFASYFMYGLQNFNTDKVIDEACKLFNLRLAHSQPPMLFYLKDEDDNTIELEFKEENFGY